MSDAISKHVSQNCNTLLSDGLLNGAQANFFCRFTIDKKESIIKINGPHPKLEAKRVIELILTLDKPGIQLGKPVMVTFDLPITFNTKKKTTK